jgi:hypothetical protein
MAVMYENEASSVAALVKSRGKLAPKQKSMMQRRYVPGLVLVS